MPNPLSVDIRARYEVLFNEGLSGREISHRLLISAASASRLSQRLKRARADWFAHRVPAISAMPERVVFLDETSVKTNLTRLRGDPCAGRD